MLIDNFHTKEEKTQLKTKFTIGYFVDKKNTTVVHIQPFVYMIFSVPN